MPAGKTTLLPAGNEADVRKKRRQATFCQLNYSYRPR
jgi:hypothetical protein